VDQSPQGFASEDEEATYCLSLLRDGDRHQKIVARERLSQIFERRGLLDEAAQCLEANIREGVRDPRVYQRLAGVYRRQGRHELADEVLVEARRLAERMARPQPPGARRPGPGPVRPGRQAPPTPPPGTLQAPTAQMPAAVPPPPPAPAQSVRVPAPPGGGGELELDRIGVGPRPGSGLEPIADEATPRDQPWWVSPPMLVLLVLLCGPYGLALMWVRGAYARQTKRSVTLIWGALAVLMSAAIAIGGQSYLTSMVAASAGLGALPGVQPTPIVFGPTPSTAAKPALPAGAAPPPPVITASPGLQPPGVAGTAINPPGSAAEPKPGGSPTTVAQSPSPPAEGEKVKVKESDGTGANLRDKPGQTGTVVKTIPEGTVLQVVGEDKQMDGKTWKNVKDDAGTTGWMASELLEPA
jgi:hypothetical protein